MSLALLQHLGHRPLNRALGERLHSYCLDVTVLTDTFFDFKLVLGDLWVLPTLPRQAFL